MTAVWIVVFILVVIFGLVYFLYYLESNGYLKINLFIPKKFKKPALPFRELTSEEKNVLNLNYSEAKSLKFHKKTIIFLSIFSNLSLLAIIIWLLTTRTLLGILALSGLLPILIMAMIYEGGFLIKSQMVDKFKLDLADKVYQVSGFLVVSSNTKRGIGSAYEFSVNGYEFAVDKDLYDSFQFDEFVTAEFSPRTLTLWKVYRAEIPK